RFRGSAGGNPGFSFGGGRQWGVDELFWFLLIMATRIVRWVSYLFVIIMTLVTGPILLVLLRERKPETDLASIEFAAGKTWQYSRMLVERNIELAKELGLVDDEQVN